jgi:hypothetical protein
MVSQVSVPLLFLLLLLFPVRHYCYYCYCYCYCYSYSYCYWYYCRYCTVTVTDTVGVTGTVPRASQHSPRFLTLSSTLFILKSNPHRILRFADTHRLIFGYMLWPGSQIVRTWQPHWQVLWGCNSEYASSTSSLGVTAFTIFKLPSIRIFLSELPTTEIIFRITFVQKRFWFFDSLESFWNHCSGFRGVFTCATCALSTCSLHIAQSQSQQDYLLTHTHWELGVKPK